MISFELSVYFHFQYYCCRFCLAGVSLILAVISCPRLSLALLTLLTVLVLTWFVRTRLTSHSSHPASSQLRPQSSTLCRDIEIRADQNSFLVTEENVSWKLK